MCYDLGVQVRETIHRSCFSPYSMWVMCIELRSTGSSVGNTEPPHQQPPNPNTHIGFSV